MPFFASEIPNKVYSKRVEMTKFVLMIGMLDLPFVFQSFFLHTAALIKTLFVSSCTSKISMRNYIQHHDEGTGPNRDHFNQKTFLDCRSQQVTNITVSVTPCHRKNNRLFRNFQRNSKGCHR